MQLQQMKSLYLNPEKMNTGNSRKSLNNTKKVSVLLIDSSPLILTRMEEMLQDYFFVGAIISSTNIANSFSLIQEHNPDVLIIDISTFEENAVQIVQQIKASFSHIKIIMQTNLSEQYHQYYRWLFEQLGADYFIDKSNEFNLLQDILKEIYEKK
jgi:DNA-binding NarL/FixJ family response regulator